MRRALIAIAIAPDERDGDGDGQSQRAAQQAQLARSTRWMQEQLKHSIAQATATPWILDCDTTIKVLYGKQEGAVVSDNPAPAWAAEPCHPHLLDRQAAPGA